MNHILIVDDLPDARHLLQDAVRTAFPKASHQLADSVRAGLQAIETTQFDLALVDLMLGDGHGSELIAQLSIRQSNCIIVVSTVMGDDDNLFAALQAGAQGYLLKDQAPHLLQRQLMGIADGNLPLSPSIARKLMKYFQPDTQTNQNVLCSLSAREMEVLKLLAKGIRITDIALELRISHHTVGDHVKNIYRKLNISSRAEAALKAKDLGLI